MKRLIILSLIVLLAQTVHCQESKSGREVSGIIMDYVTNTCIEDTLNVQLLNADSTFVCEALVYNQGEHGFGSRKAFKERTRFEFSVDKPGKYIIYCQPTSNYYPLYSPVEIKFHKREKSIDVGYLLLKHKPYTDNSINLNEVVVKATKVKFYFDNDTLVYNADAFTTQKGFVLNDILNKMPGIEIHQDGEIIANGRKIDELLLNGKDFFNNDRKTLLDNMPAFMVKNVKIYEKTKDSLSLIKREREYSGYVMDVKLKKEYSSSFIGNTDLGYGTDSRYFLKAFGMKFNALGRVSSDLSLNNINKGDYSNGRGDMYNYQSNDGDIKFDKWSLFYNYDHLKGLYSVNGNVQVNYTDQYTENKTFSQNYYSTGDVFSRQYYNNNTYHFKTSTDHQLYLLGNTPFDINIQPHLMYEKRRMNMLTVTGMYDDNMCTSWGNDWVDSLLTKETGLFLDLYGISRSRRQSQNDATSLMAWVDVTKDIKIPHTDDNLNLSAGYRYHKLSVEDNINNKINYYQKGNAEYLTQLQKNNQKTLEAKAHVVYNCVLGNNDIKLEYNFNRNSVNNNNPIYAMHEIAYSDSTKYILPSQEELLNNLDKDNSYSYHQINNCHVANLEYTYSLRGSANTTLSCNVPLTLERKSLTFYRNQEETRAKRNMLKPSFALKFGNNKSIPNKHYHLITLDYEYKVEAPSLYNMITFRNTSNPLYIENGNPDLKDIYSHNFSGQIFWQNSRSDIHRMNFSYLITRNQVANMRYFNTVTGVTESMPMNIDGNSNFRINFANQIYYKKRQPSYFSNDISFIINKSVDYESTESLQDVNKSVVNTFAITEELGSNIILCDNKLTIGGSLYAIYRHSAKKNDDSNRINVTDYGIKCSMSCELPKI